MKIYLLFFFTVLFACSDTPEQETQVQPQANDYDWEISKATTYKHYFNKLGLLDSSYKVQNIYVDGKVGVILKFLIVRNYNGKNKVIAERTFQVLKKNELTEEKRLKYDADNNVIEEITTANNVVITRTNKTYNNLNQEIKRIEIMRIPEATAEEWTLDSAVAHNNDPKKKPNYDTIVISSSYDKEGNLVKQVYGSVKGKVGETLLTEYSNKQKTFTYKINAKGDTISIIKYEQVAHQTKATEEHKVHPHVETSWYEQDKIVQYIYVDKEMNWKQKEVYKYDERGNEMENISYK